MQDGGIGVRHLDTKTKSLGVLHPEVQVVGPVRVAPNPEVLFVDHVEFHRAEHGVGTNGHTVVAAAKEGQFEFCFICLADRAPIIAPGGGNHLHKPSCKYWAPEHAVSTPLERVVAAGFDEAAARAALNDANGDAQAAILSLLAAA